MKELLQTPIKLFKPEKFGLPKPEKTALEKRSEKVKTIYENALFDQDYLTSRRAFDLLNRIEAEILIRNSY